MNEFEQILLTTDRIAAQKLVTNLLATMTIDEFLDEHLVHALTQIGEKWEKGEASLSQVYMSGKICEEIVDQLLTADESKIIKPIRLGIVVLDDFHLLGKRIVYSIVRSAGYDIKDYGRATVDEIIPKISEDQLDILLVSTLMLRSALQIETLKSQFIQKNIPTHIVVGGAPFRFDNQLWNQVGADNVGYTASDALRVINDYQERKQ